MKRVICIILIASFSHMCFAATDINCKIFNGKQLVTTKSVSLRNKDFPSLWAKKNPARYASHVYRRQFCQDVGLTDKASQKNVTLKGSLQHNITVRKRAIPNESCQLSCVKTNGYGGGTAPQAASNLSVASQALGYIIG